MVLVLVSQAIVADARHCVPASTGLPGGGDGILDRAVAQPASIAPVHPSSPCVVQLLEGRHGGVLFATRPLRIVKVEVVATQTREVGVDDTYSTRGTKAVS